MDPTPSNKLREDIAARLVDSDPQIRDLVVTQLAQEEIDARTSATIAVLNKIGEKEKELRKLESKGEVKFALSGDVASDPVFTKEQLEEIKKVREAIARMQNALEAAFATSNFQKLHELAKQ
jgi:hypothetical protein